MSTKNAGRPAGLFLCLNTTPWRRDQYTQSLLEFFVPLYGLFIVEGSGYSYCYAAFQKPSRRRPWVHWAFWYKESLLSVISASHLRLIVAIQTRFLNRRWNCSFFAYKGRNIITYVTQVLISWWLDEKIYNCFEHVFE